MTKPILLVTRPLLKEVDDRVVQEFSPRRLPDGPLTNDELVASSDGASAVLVNPSVPLNADFFNRIPSSVKVVATMSVGYDHIDLAAAKRKNVPVANTPGVLTDAVADATIFLLLSASRHAYEAQEFLRSGEWERKTQPANLLGLQVTGKILGIYGMGRIGQGVADRARALGMKIHYSDRSELPADLAKGAEFHTDPKDLLRVSSFLTLHAPATPETHHFLNVETIALLPAAAIVVNTARGELVCDEDLIAALRSGRVAAAGLDVFEHEPKINHEYFTLPNAFLMPHLAGATVETLTAVEMLALDNIEAVLAGRPAPTLLTG
jgi:lactate dehydrogenase-like 2-hydroxyacid dehydrogenase